MSNTMAFGIGLMLGTGCVMAALNIAEQRGPWWPPLCMFAGALLALVMSR